MTKTETILALCEAATPGPWETDIKDHDCPHQDIRIRHNKGNIKRTICTVWIDDACYDENPQQERNAHFIAACNPAEVKRMVEIMLQMREALEFASDFIPAACCKVGECELCKAIAAFDAWQGGEE